MEDLLLLISPSYFDKTFLKIKKTSITITIFIINHKALYITHDRSQGLQGFVDVIVYVTKDLHDFASI